MENMKDKSRDGMFEGMGIAPDLERWMTLADLYLLLTTEYSHRRPITRDAEAMVPRLPEKRASKNDDTIRCEIERLESELFNGDDNAKSDGSFASLIEEHNLTRDEARALAILVNLAIRRFFGYGFHEVNCHSILFWSGDTLSDVMKRCEVFTDNSNLIKHGLLDTEEGVISSPYRDKGRYNYNPSLDTLTYLLGDMGERVYFTIAGRHIMRRGDYDSSSERYLNIFEPRVTLDDVILPEETKNAVMEALAIVEQSDLLFDEWKIGRVIEKGKGIILLFYGPPGTGKTMTAEALAHHLKKEVCLVNYARVENPFVGMSEKNIDAMFKEARERDLFLLFDECDSIVTARVNERSIDKYYNKLVNLILRNVEDYEGVLVMTTNRAEFLDEALQRRLALKVKFGMPGPAERVKIWQRFLSLEGAVSDDVDVDLLAGDYEFSGGEIKNAFYTGARSAARRVHEGEGERLITMEDLLKGCRLVKEGAGEKGGERLGF